MDDVFAQAADAIKNSKNMIALTGAGISVESGIPDFRSAGGLWDKYDPAVYATIDSFRRNPEMVWQMLFDMADIIVNARPNDGHLALARMEELGYLKSIITQNIDNLHQLAGSKSVIEYHGNASRLECLSCGTIHDNIQSGSEVLEPPRCPTCRKILKPTVIFFGEMIPQDAMFRSSRLAEKADVVLVVGTSALVYPAAAIPIEAKQNNATVIEFNLEPTPLTGHVTDIFVQGSSGVTLKQVVELLEKG